MSNCHFLDFLEAELRADSEFVSMDSPESDSAHGGAFVQPACASSSALVSVPDVGQPGSFRKPTSWEWTRFSDALMDPELLDKFCHTLVCFYPKPCQQKFIRTIRLNHEFFGLKSRTLGMTTNYSGTDVVQKVLKVPLRVLALP